MNDGMDALRETFRQEARDLLAEIETSLLELENAPDDMEVISSVFRAFHTLKGSGAMCGFYEVSTFTHHIETVYELVRNRKLAVDRTLIDLTLDARDLINDMISSPETYIETGLERESRILDSFAHLMPEEESLKVMETGPAAQAKVVHEQQITCRIRFKPYPDIFLSGINPLLILSDLRSLGESSIVAQTEGIPELARLDPEKCYTFWDVILTTNKGIDAVRDVFIFVEDKCDLRIDIIDDGTFSLEEKEYRKLGEILVDKRDLSKEDLERVLKTRKLIGTALVEEGLVGQTTVEAALAEQEHIRMLRERRLREDAILNLRVSSDKLDKLVNLVGELVTVQARLSQTAIVRNDHELISIAEEVERLTGNLRDNTMNIRLVPIGTIFSKFKRLVRDLSKELGKEVEFITTGAETEMDKSVIEKMNDPLIHLIRNSIDHGIEPPETREMAGKPRKGTIHLEAAHAGDHVTITITDNGSGLDTALIRAKAVETGLISTDENPTDKDIHSLIFSPGFSTAGSVTKVSGRGVGMDVVRKAVESLRGKIEIESRKGSGTTFTLALPLTLAIIEGLLVKVAQEYFVLPLASVEECIELRRDEVKKFNNRHVVNVRGSLIPYIRLREQFMINGDIPAIEQVVIAGSDGQRVGFAVDSVIGEHQVVIKALGRVFKEIEGISGATILGDGTIALILDIPKLINIAEEEEHASLEGRSTLEQYK